ncbi:PLP-dependent aminotransferase family protein [Fulvimarina sp. MAC8]|uniref:aminotransferase-like domain-containing protein n=1 Tax=Fulvimarina sp. MAC8 TaxID=3162874 RepID=UPI0032EB33ED
MEQIGADTDSARTRVGLVMETIRQRVAGRSLSPGEKLPSIRAQAKTMRLSPSTVVEAYERLAAEGLIRSRPGSGFYVAGSLPLALREVEPQLDRAVDPLWVSRQSLDSGHGTVRPGCGWLPADWMPEDAIRRAMRSLAKAENSLLADYGPARGSLELRSLLARQFAAEGLNAGADQILLSASGTQAIDLVCRFLLQPGDTVLLDDPCYFNFQALMRSHRVTVVGIPRTENGPDLAAFEGALQAYRPRLYVTNSAIHNPTGASLSPQIAHRVLTLAAAHDLTIVEDDIFADFEPAPSPRLAVLDGLERTVRVGSFSKTLSASIRCGYIAASADWIEGLVDLQVATNFGGPSPMAAAIVNHVLSDGSYRKHVTSLRTRLAKKRREAAAILARLGIAPWIDPAGGFYLWCRLPGDVDAAEVARAALRDDVVLAPGNVFSVAQTATKWMRFNVAQMADPKLPDSLQHAIASSWTSAGDRRP